jgi:NAD(P)H dehydrogenase (quinone)
MEIQILFYSMYGHIYTMARAVAAGAQEVAGAEVKLFQVPELVPEEALVRTGAKQAREAFAHVPVAKPDDLTSADAIIFGIPTRFGNMAAQMRNFLDHLGRLWAEDAFVGKVGSIFASTGTQHGGQETTIITSQVTLFHLGMIVVGLPYSNKALTGMDEIQGGTPYGATTLADGDGSRQPSEIELGLAKAQGRWVAQITQALKQGGWQSGAA